jgi:hypothetical protein
LTLPLLSDQLAVPRPVGYDRRWWVLAVLCLSLLVIGIDTTILNVALPTLSRTLHATNSQLQWIVDAYVLVWLPNRAAPPASDPDLQFGDEEAKVVATVP